MLNPHEVPHEVLAGVILLQTAPLTAPIYYSSTLCLSTNLSSNPRHWLSPSGSPSAFPNKKNFQREKSACRLPIPLAAPLHPHFTYSSGTLDFVSLPSLILSLTFGIGLIVAKDVHLQLSPTGRCSHEMTLAASPAFASPLLLKSGPYIHFWNLF